MGLEDYTISAWERLNEQLAKQHGFVVGMRVEVTPEFEFNYRSWQEINLIILIIEYVDDDNLLITVRDDRGVEYTGFKIKDLRERIQ
jgi:hypothetical protein